MADVLVFGEDYAHEVVLRTLLGRMAADYHVAVKVDVRSATGGHGRVLNELEKFIKELKRGQISLPDLFVVARDANCLGYAQRVKEIATVVKEYQGLLVSAVPDPHVERWLLIDSQAFRQVLGQGCQTPDQKCDRDRYKQLLDAAVRAAGVEPLLGGLEFADASFAHLLGDLRSAFQRWQPRETDR